ncbi:MAG: hypothetical protein J0H98_02805 [Solirubrobacterales bacterium]|nr:hypothetical protein [Solirubrobacterales bacterium]
MEVRGEARAVFAAVLLLIAGVLNVIYGIAAIGNSSFFTDAGAHYVFSGLKTWGWVTLLIAVVQVTGGLSLFGGGTYGRVIGLIGASLGAIASLLAVGGAYPFWSLGIFALCVIVIHGLIVYGEPIEGER